MQSLESILQESAKRHKHLCPRQVLGARMALFASELLGLELPCGNKHMLVTAETDGCTVDGLISATGCRAGSRTLRILDFGKVAATFTNICAGKSIRVTPRREARSIVWDYVPAARNKWEAMLFGYQIMPARELFTVQHVELNESLARIISQPGRKMVCKVCEEEIINGREVMNNNLVLCRSCAGERYYDVLVPS